MQRWRALVVVTVLLGACGADDDTAADRAGTVESSTTEDGGTPSTAPAEDAEERPLEDVVLQLSDLPTGWSAAPAEEDDDESFCDGRDPFNEIEPQDEAESTFQQSELGPFVVSAASRYSDDAEAAEVLDLLADVAEACQSFSVTEDDGSETEYTITPLSFPELGDDTFAFRMSATTVLGPITLDLAAVQEGPIVVSVGNGGLGSADGELTEALMRTMVDRL